jgi:hypothetical protein
LGRIVTLLIFASGLLAAAPPALAADPPPSMVGMPDPSIVSTRFVGTEARDTAAIQVAAFERLDELAGKLIPKDRLPSVDEIQFQHAYTDAWTALVRQVKNSLPADQQTYGIGTGFAAWYAQVDHYRADPSFNTQFRTLFSSDFLTAHSAIFTELEQIGRSPLLPAPAPTPAPITTQIADDLSKVIPTLVDYARDYAPFFGLLAIYLVLFAVMGPSRKSRQRHEGPRS